MQTARIPMAILLALELTVAAACTPTVGPCLEVAPPEDDGKQGDDGPEMTPCLSPPEPDPPLGPCLEVAPPPDPPQKPQKPPEVGPCLKVAAPEEEPQPRVGPCLRVAAPPEEPSVGPCLDIVEPESPEGSPRSKAKGQPGETARADVIEKLADTLPADVLAKLRKRDA